MIAWLATYMLVRVMVTAACGYALLRGGEPERFVGAVVLAGFVADELNHALLGRPVFDVINPGHVVIDTWLLIVLTWTALRANRGWTLAVAALQLIVVIGHLAKFADMGSVRRAYFTMTFFPFYVQLLVLLVGTHAHRRRLVRWGDYPGWGAALDA